MGDLAGKHNRYGPSESGISIGPVPNVSHDAHKRARILTKLGQRKLKSIANARSGLSSIETGAVLIHASEATALQVTRARTSVSRRT